MVVVVRILLVGLAGEFPMLVPAVLVLLDRNEVQLLPMLVGRSLVLVIMPMLVRVGVRMLVRMGVHQVAVPVLVLVCMRMRVRVLVGMHVAVPALVVVVVRHRQPLIRRWRLEDAELRGNARVEHVLLLAAHEVQQSLRLVVRDDELDLDGQ